MVSNNSCHSNDACEEKKDNEPNDTPSNNKDDSSSISSIIDVIKSTNDTIRNKSLNELLLLLSSPNSNDDGLKNNNNNNKQEEIEMLLQTCDILDEFWRSSTNLYEKVRALFFLSHIYKFHIPQLLEQQKQQAQEEESSTTNDDNKIPYEGIVYLRQRHFIDAIDVFLKKKKESSSGQLRKRRSNDGGCITISISDGLCSALSKAYHSLGFQTLADQVKISVKESHGNQWMFSTMNHHNDHPLQIRKELLTTTTTNGDNLNNIHNNNVLCYPMLKEMTPVRMDLTHSGWSDIFFLGMDFPDGARVLNISIDLAIQTTSNTKNTNNNNHNNKPRPPIETYFRIIDEPVLRLVSIDLNVSTDITNLHDIYDFGKDYLGLLKSAVIAAGIVPPGMEGSGIDLKDILERLIGKPNMGIELVSCVNGIPKGSRLAVSTNLLASLIAICMRATGQTSSIDGILTESERRIVASRAILGEWLGGSGGGWQDSGGVWPGIKLIEGTHATHSDPEHGISRGCLLPKHRILKEDGVEINEHIRHKLQKSLILVHGGMAQNVGPILEMVTEKYLLRSQPEWNARIESITLLDEMLDALKHGDIKRVGSITTRNFFDNLQTIIPEASNAYTERLVKEMADQYDDDFWGFWMLGGMSGGGMGFIVNPTVKDTAITFLQNSMSKAKNELQQSLPFAMEPVVYDFDINDHGTRSVLLHKKDAIMPRSYYERAIPSWLRLDPSNRTPARQSELSIVNKGWLEPSITIESSVSSTDAASNERANIKEEQCCQLEKLLDSIGFDQIMQEDIRTKLRAGELGLAQNQLPVSTIIEDAYVDDVVSVDIAAVDVCSSNNSEFEACRTLGEASLTNGEVAVVTLSAGTGSRWTKGAGVVKGLNPFCRLEDVHRSFIEIHLAKSQKTSDEFKTTIPHVFTTSYLTDEPIRSTLDRTNNYGYDGGPVYCSKGSAVGVRMIPMVRDLKFAFTEAPQQLLDQQAEKMKTSVNAAFIKWAEEAGEGTDYKDNIPNQCLHPVGHWFEIPNLLRNGTLADMLDKHPKLKTLLVHNIDTTGVNVDPTILGLHLKSNTALSLEVISRRIDDAGGGLGRVNGKLQIIEGLSLPADEIDYELTYYNTMSTWINIDKLLDAFDISRTDLRNEEKISTAIRNVASKLPTYVTLKDVKKRWGHGQEDVLPVSQYEKLWSDMTMLADCRFIHVNRKRGQQLKDPSQLDGFFNDGSMDYVNELCTFK